MTASHTHTLHPKEEQPGSPGGHLFAQVCSPSVIKIGAAHPHSSAAVCQRRGYRGMSVRCVEQLCCFGADGADDGSLSERGRSNPRGKGAGKFKTTVL